MIVVKIKEWSSKLQVEQLPSKNPEKNFQVPVRFPPMISEMLQLTLLQSWDWMSRISQEQDKPMWKQKS